MLFPAVVGALVGLSRGAGAGVEDTHHDMRLYVGETAQSVCSYCHVPHLAAAEGLLREEGRYKAELGRVGSFCYTCHDGTVIPTALVEAPDGAIGVEALTRSHGYRIDNLSRVTEGLEGPSSVRSSGLVPVDAATGTLPDRLECTGCHDPHSSEHPPFLRAPLETLCELCHSGSDGRGAGRHRAVDAPDSTRGPHPVGMPVAFSGRARKRPEQQVPERVFHSVDPKLRVAGLTAQELGDPGKHWATGGHLGGFGTEAGDGRVICSTCHSAHSTRPNLLVLPSYDPGKATDPLCNGCHGALETPQNPGGTAFWHPAEAESAAPYATSTTPSRPLDVKLPSDWPLAESGALLCATCHLPHRAKEGTSCLRPHSKRFVCDACHLVEPANARATRTPGENSHHMTTPDDVSALLRGRVLSWARGSGEPGDLADGLQCVDCHTELAKSAHNW